MIRRHTPALVLGLLSFVLTSAAFAQQPPTGDTGQRNGGPPVVEPHQRPVFAASNLEVTQAGALTMVKVHGMTTTAGWQEPALIPLSRGIPPDGILDMILVAEPPPEAMAATGFAPVEAVLLIEQNHPYRGVRIRSATNVLAVASLPGHADATTAGDDCHACVGRTLGDIAGPDAIARIALPKGTRVLGPTDPFPDLEPDPNRLTLLVGADGRVTEAVWQ